MSVLKKEELFEKMKTILGDRTDDDALTFMEDLKDTIEDSEKDKKDEEDWQKKYEDNDKMWREKYRDRFFKSSGDEKDDIEETIQPKETEEKPLTFENLFKEENDNGN